MNKVLKVIRDGNTLVFIIQTDGDNDFWYWQVSFEDWKNYFLDRRDPFFGVLTESRANKFCNDFKTSTCGYSSSGYSNIEQILKEFEVIK